ncbi:MAG: mechanosensitive ion channel domain-containing protein [Thermoplasmata archaeon]
MTGLSYLPTLIPVLVAAGVAVGGYLLSEWVAVGIRRHGAMPYQVRWARLIISLLGVVAAGLILFAAYGSLSLVSGLTFSAILTLAATLALQTTIGNVIAGFILLRDRVLRMDDRIQISGIQGTVVRIGIVTVWVRLDNGSLASVSNSTLLGGPLVNQSAAVRLKGEF